MYHAPQSTQLEHLPCLYEWNTGHVTFVAFSFIPQHTLRRWTQMGSRQLLTGYGDNVCPRCKKQRTTSDQITLMPIIASCADKNAVGWRWANLSSYVLTVCLTTISGHLFQCSAINQNDSSFPLTVNSTNEFSIISPSIRKISKMQTWRWWFTGLAEKEKWSRTHSFLPN